MREVRNVYPTSLAIREARVHSAERELRLIGGGILAIVAGTLWLSVAINAAVPHRLLATVAAGNGEISNIVAVKQENMAYRK